MYSCYSALEPMGPALQDLQVDVRPQAHVPRLDLEDLKAALLHKNAHVKLTVEQAKPAEHQLDDALLDLAPGLDVDGHDRIELGDEDDGANATKLPNVAVNDETSAPCHTPLRGGRRVQYHTPVVEARDLDGGPR